MIGKDKAIEVVGYLIQHGVEATCEAFSLSAETLNRYRREAKKYFGDSLDNIIKLSNNFTGEEISKIANGSYAKATELKAHTISFKGEIITFGVMGDTHIGSIYSEETHTLSAFKEMEKQGCSFLCHTGDLVDGMMGRPGDIYELSHLGYKQQRDEAVRIFSQWKKPQYIISGNHDASFNSKLGAGMDIVEDVCSRIPDAKYLGINEGDLNINGIVIKLWHGGDGSSYALTYRDQKLVESFTGGEKPNILCTGHIHKAYTFFYRNVHVIGAGCLQKQSGWMRSKKLAAHQGFHVVKACIADNEVKWLESRFYPFY